MLISYSREQNKQQTRYPDTRYRMSDNLYWKFDLLQHEFK